MISDKQIAANRANAKRSTGPKTAEGKNVARLNAVRHGGLSPLPVLPDVETRDAWQIHLDGTLANAGAELFSRIAGDGRVIVVLPKSNLNGVVDTMMASDRLAGIIVAEQFDHAITPRYHLTD